jgi:hypothetical protein
MVAHHFDEPYCRGFGPEAFLAFAVPRYETDVAALIGRE